MQIGIVLYHQLDVCPLVNQHGPKTKKAMEQATLIAMDRGAHVVPTGHKGHVRAKKKGNWVHKNNRIREEELEVHEVEQHGLKKKKKKKRHHEEVCEDQEVGQEVSRKKKTKRPKGGNELAEDYASPVSTKSQLRTGPSATPMTSPEDSSMSRAGSPNEERRKVSIEEQQTERAEYINRTSVKLSVTKWQGIASKNQKPFEFQYRAVFYASNAVSRGDRKCANMSCETRQENSRALGLLRDEPRIEIETRKVLGNGVPSPNAQWKLQTVCCSEVVTLLMPLNITLVLMLPGLVPRDLYA